MHALAVCITLLILAGCGGGDESTESAPTINQPMDGSNGGGDGIADGGDGTGSSSGGDRPATDREKPPNGGDGAANGSEGTGSSSDRDESATSGDAPPNGDDGISNDGDGTADGGDIPANGGDEVANGGDTPADGAGGGEKKPPTTVAMDDIRNLADFRKNCARMNRTLTPANVVYDPTLAMRRGDSTSVEAAVTLSVHAPPDEVLGVRGATADEVLVSCSVEAQLQAPRREFKIEDRGWQLQRLTTGSTAKWIWFVTPRVGGSHELILLVRPVIVVQPERNRSNQDEPILRNALAESDATEARYTMVVNVSVPPDEELLENLNTGTTVLARTRALFIALAGAIAAAIVVWRTIRGKRQTNNKQAPPEPQHTSEMGSTGPND